MEKEFSSHMDTLSQGMNELREEGYVHEFAVNDQGGLEAKDLEKTFNAKQCEVRETRRYEGSSNPSDLSILYAIETNDGKKGLLVNAYGANSSEDVNDFIRKAEVK